MYSEWPVRARQQVGSPLGQPRGAAGSTAPKCYGRAVFHLAQLHLLALGHLLCARHLILGALVTAAGARSRLVERSIPISRLRSRSTVAVRPNIRWTEIRCAKTPLFTGAGTRVTARKEAPIVRSAKGFYGHTLVRRRTARVRARLVVWRKRLLRVVRAHAGINPVCVNRRLLRSSSAGTEDGSSDQQREWRARRRHTGLSDR